MLRIIPEPDEVSGGPRSGYHWNLVLETSPLRNVLLYKSDSNTQFYNFPLTAFIEKVRVTALQGPRRITKRKCKIKITRKLLSSSDILSSEVVYRSLHS